MVTEVLHPRHPSVAAAVLPEEDTGGNPSQMGQHRVTSYTRLASRRGWRIAQPRGAA